MVKTSASLSLESRSSSEDSYERKGKLKRLSVRLSHLRPFNLVCGTRNRDPCSPNHLWMCSDGLPSILSTFTPVCQAVIWSSRMDANARSEQAREGVQMERSNLGNSTCDEPWMSPGCRACATFDCTVAWKHTLVYLCDLIAVYEEPLPVSSCWFAAIMVR